MRPLPLPRGCPAARVLGRRRLAAGVVLALAAPASATATADTAPAVPAPGAGYRVVVHADVPVTSLPPDEVSRLFLKKTVYWRGGQRVRPVDQPTAAAVRATFSAEVHRRPVPLIQTYWQQMVFAGRDAPPPVLKSDQDVIRFVHDTPGAVGYVSPAAQVGGGVRVVEVTR